MDGTPLQDRNAPNNQDTDSTLNSRNEGGVFSTLVDWVSAPFYRIQGWQSLGSSASTDQIEITPQNPALTDREAETQPLLNNVPSDNDRNSVASQSSRLDQNIQPTLTNSDNIASNQNLSTEDDIQVLEEIIPPDPPVNNDSNDGSLQDTANAVPNPQRTLSWWRVWLCCQINQERDTEAQREPLIPTNDQPAGEDQQEEQQGFWSSLSCCGKRDKKDKGKGKDDADEPDTALPDGQYQHQRAKKMVEILKRENVVLFGTDKEEKAIVEMITKMFLDTSNKNAFFKSFCEEFVPDKKKYEDPNMSEESQKEKPKKLKTSMSKNEVKYAVKKLGVRVARYRALKKLEQDRTCRCLYSSSRLKEIRKTDRDINEAFLRLETRNLAKIIGDMFDTVIDKVMDLLGGPNWEDNTALCTIGTKYKKQIRGMAQAGAAVIVEIKKTSLEEEDRSFLSKLSEYQPKNVEDKFAKREVAFETKFDRNKTRNTIPLLGDLARILGEKDIPDGPWFVDPQEDDQSVQNQGNDQSIQNRKKKKSGSILSGTSSGHSTAVELQTSQKSGGGDGGSRRQVSVESFLQEVLKPMKEEDYLALRIQDNETPIKDLQERLDADERKLFNRIYEHVKVAIGSPIANDAANERLKREILHLFLDFEKKKANPSDNSTKSDPANQISDDIITVQTYTAGPPDPSAPFEPGFSEEQEVKMYIKARAEELPEADPGQEKADPEIIRILVAFLGRYEEEFANRGNTGNDYQLTQLEQQKKDGDFHREAKENFYHNFGELVESLLPHLRPSNASVILNALIQGLVSCELQCWLDLHEKMGEKRLKDMKKEWTHRFASHLNSRLGNFLVATAIPSLLLAIWHHYYPPEVVVREK